MDNIIYAPVGKPNGAYHFKTETKMYIEKDLISTLTPQNQVINSLKLPAVAFDLPSLIEVMKEERKWKMGELNTRLLLKSPEKTILLTILYKDTEIKSFLEKGSINIQVIEGKLNMHKRHESIPLCEGEDLTLNEKMNYSLDSVEDTAFLLTMVW